MVIPARLASTRLPRKLLLKETGKTVLQHTYESAAKSTLADRIIVAADDIEIVDAVKQFGGDVILTDPDHVCGTDRVAEVAATLSEFEIIVNVQGDEPEIAATAIDQAIGLLDRNPDIPMATLATPIRSRQMLEDPNCVKIVFDNQMHAIYFSRSVIPHPRDWSDEYLTAEPALFFQHVGLYCYRRGFLQNIPKLLPTSIEKAESLEQLRILSNGHKILVGKIDHPITGIDTREDYQSFVRRHSNC
ncbi:MAG: 3-deoxy-manno-octulosonate cytidylyltransferase [Planctomycetaceae bacterium]|nr:3-deoxy-manno-octulosonate cytidylyltransferase [Planctomycetaceae bacterium]